MRERRSARTDRSEPPEGRNGEGHLRAGQPDGKRVDFSARSVVRRFNISIPRTSGVPLKGRDDADDAPETVREGNLDALTLRGAATYGVPRDAPRALRRGVGVALRPELPPCASSLRVGDVVDRDRTSSLFNRQPSRTG
jgi:hypothetical protein